MTGYTSLSELDEAHQAAGTAARHRLEKAEECVAYYRSQMIRMQENFYELAVREGKQDAPGFRDALQRVTGQTDQRVWEASRVIARFEEEHAELASQHSKERERYLEQARDDR